MIGQDRLEMNKQNIEDLYNDDDEAMDKVFLHQNKSKNTK